MESAIAKMTQGHLRSESNASIVGGRCISRMTGRREVGEGKKLKTLTLSNKNV